MSRRPGYTLLELLVVLGLGGIISSALTATLLAHLRIARTIGARVTSADAARLTLQVLGAELRLAVPPVDLHGIGADSIAARLPRLAGVICGGTPGRLLVRGNGIRDPDSGKDSVLLISAGAELRAAVSAAAEAPGACPAEPGELVYRLDTSAPLPAAGVIVLFESGTYYLRDRAFRFRIGGEGRQPLTGEVLLDRGSGIALRRDTVHASFTFRLSFAPGFDGPALPALEAGVTLPNASVHR